MHKIPVCDASIDVDDRNIDVDLSSIGVDGDSIDVDPGGIGVDLGTIDVDPGRIRVDGGDIDVDTRSVAVDTGGADGTGGVPAEYCEGIGVLGAVRRIGTPATTVEQLRVGLRVLLLVVFLVGMSTSTPTRRGRLHRD